MARVLGPIFSRTPLGVEVHGGGIHIGQNRNRSRVDDGVDGGAKRQGGGDDLVAGFQVKGQDAQMQGRGAGVHGQADGDPAVGGELLFEAGHLRARAQPARTQGGGDLFDFRLAYLGRAEDEKVFLGANGVIHGGYPLRCFLISKAGPVLIYYWEREMGTIFLFPVIRVGHAA